MNRQTAKVISDTEKNVHRLVDECRKHGPLYEQNPKIVAPRQPNEQVAAERDRQAEHGTQTSQGDFMKLCDQLTDYVNAAFTGLYVQSHEPDEAEHEIVQHAKQKNWKVAVWDVANGLRFPNGPSNGSTEVGAGDPLAVLRSLPTLASEDGTALLLLHNFHRFLNNPEVVQTTFAQLIAGKQQRTFIVVLSAVVQIPGRAGEAVRRHRTQLA